MLWEELGEGKNMIKLYVKKRKKIKCWSGQFTNSYSTTLWKSLFVPRFLDMETKAPVSTWEGQELNSGSLAVALLPYPACLTVWQKIIIRPPNKCNTPIICLCPRGNSLSRESELVTAVIAFSKSHMLLMPEPLPWVLNSHLNLHIKSSKPHATWAPPTPGPLHEIHHFPQDSRETSERAGEAANEEPLNPGNQAF